MHSLNESLCSMQTLNKTLSDGHWVPLVAPVPQKMNGPNRRLQPLLPLCLPAAAVSNTATASGVCEASQQSLLLHLHGVRHRVVEEQTNMIALLSGTTTRQYHA